MKPLGMMSGCYFVGRGELLEWLNDLLSINYSRIEDASNGAAFCQVIDVIHPGTLNLKKVNYNAEQGFEMTQNYRLLQDAFRKNGIAHNVDVLTLTKGKYMAALELLQWVHGYYQQTGEHGAYDAVERRRATGCAEPKAQPEKTKKTSGFPTSRPLIPIKGSDPTIGKVCGPAVKPSVRASRPAPGPGRENSARTDQVQELQEKYESLQRKFAKADEYLRQFPDEEVLQPLREIFSE
jgi:RP/EB family microtubule-associated protein